LTRVVIARARGADNWFEYTHSQDAAPESDDHFTTLCFAQAFGRPRADRFGKRDLVKLKNLNPDQTGQAPDWPAVAKDRTYAREYFDRAYWGPCVGSVAAPRRVFIMFCGAAPIGLRRLIEVARARGGRLASVLMIAVPMSDPIVAAGSIALVNARLRSLRINPADATQAQQNEARDALTSEAFSTLLRSCMDIFRPAAECRRDLLVLSDVAAARGEARAHVRRACERVLAHGMTALVLHRARLRARPLPPLEQQQQTAALVQLRRAVVVVAQQRRRRRRLVSRPHRLHWPQRRSGQRRRLRASSATCRSVVVGWRWCVSGLNAHLSRSRAHLHAQAQHERDTHALQARVSELCAEVCIRALLRRLLARAVFVSGAFVVRHVCVLARLGRVRIAASRCINRSTTIAACRGARCGCIQRGNAQGCWRGDCDTAGGSC
jgi:hypothetical protein